MPNLLHLRPAPHAVQGPEPRLAGVRLGPLRVLPRLHRAVLLLRPRRLLRERAPAHLHVLRGVLLPGPRRLDQSIRAHGPLSIRPRRMRQPPHSLQQLHPAPLLHLPYPRPLQPQLPGVRRHHRPHRRHRLLLDRWLHDCPSQLRDQVSRLSRRTGHDQQRRRHRAAHSPGRRRRPGRAPLRRGHGPLSPPRSTTASLSESCYIVLAAISKNDGGISKRRPSRRAEQSLQMPLPLYDE
mmetsp:Transcript_9124/g.28975  ORF Transcript_9124/g.28975 Transcript_9124/m.28975 type:complete len:238 (+) Transcript_9124:217-930(+)